MKRLFLSLIFFTVFYSGAQIPNSSFENWTNGIPNSCFTSNNPLVAPAILPDSDAVGGFLSVKGVVVSDNNHPYPPYLAINGTSNGFPLSQSFNLLTGWCKLNLLPGDKFDCQINFYDSPMNAVALGKIIVDSSINSWTSFQIPINYTLPGQPVNGAIFFTITDSTGLSSGQIGSYFLIDELILSGIASNSSLTNDYTIQVFPNPSNGKIKISESEFENVWLSITDSKGKVLINKKYIKNEILDLEKYSSGIYFLNVYADEKRYTEKIIIY
jgi:hypothetical protein